MEAQQLRLWVDARRQAAEREARELEKAGPSPEKAIRQALALIALAGRFCGWPVLEDEVSRREDAQAHERWRRLKAMYARP